MSLALVFLLSADPSSAFIAPAVTTSTRASAASAKALSMVAATPSTWVTTKSEETFEEAKVRWLVVVVVVVAASGDLGIDRRACVATLVKGNAAFA